MLCHGYAYETKGARIMRSENSGFYYKLKKAVTDYSREFKIL